MIDAQVISEVDQAEFFAAMTGDDPLGVVIKAAIFLENQLIQLIEENVASPEDLNKVDLSYAHRVHFAAAIGLRSSLVRPLSALGKIRNKFAHRLDAALTENEADNFYRAFSPEDKGVIEQTYQRTRKKTLEAKKPAKFSSLPPLERFVICAITLRGALVTARAQARAGGGRS